MKKNIITVSREFGSGGRTIGKTVAQRLGIPYYDKELVKQVALESGFDPKYIEEQGEFAPGKTHFAFSFLGRGVPGVMGGMTAADFLWTIQHNVILDPDGEGPCVIVAGAPTIFCETAPMSAHLHPRQHGLPRPPHRAAVRRVGGGSGEAAPGQGRPPPHQLQALHRPGVGHVPELPLCLDSSYWGSISAWTSFWTWRRTARTPQNKLN